MKQALFFIDWLQSLLVSRVSFIPPEIDPRLI